MGKSKELNWIKNIDKKQHPEQIPLINIYWLFYNNYQVHLFGSKAKTINYKSQHHMPYL